MFVSDLLQFFWNCLRMTLKAHEGTKIHPPTQEFFLQTFSFMKKKPNPKPIAISGPLQVPHAPSWFLVLPVSWKTSFCFSLWANWAFSYFPATPIGHKELSPANVCISGTKAGEGDPSAAGTCTGSLFCSQFFLCRALTALRGVMGAARAAGRTLCVLQCFWAHSSLLSKNSVHMITWKSEQVLLQLPCLHSAGTAEGKWVLVSCMWDL